MEQFNIEICRLEALGDGTVYYELKPTNTELQDLLLHGQETQIVNTIVDTIEMKTNDNRIEMFEALRTSFPDVAANYYL